MRRRRFAEVWQADAQWPGTVEQQQTIRDTFHLDHGTDRWRLMKRLDKSANETYQRSYLTVGFLPDDMWPPNMIAVAGITGINFRASFAPSALRRQAEHELGHVVDKHLFTQTDRVWFMHQISGPDLGDNRWNWSYQETCADAVADWWRGTGWPSLTPILLPADLPEGP